MQGDASGGVRVMSDRDQVTAYDPELDPIFPPTDHQRTAAWMLPFWLFAALLWVCVGIAALIFTDWLACIIFLPPCAFGAFVTGRQAFDCWCEKLPRSGRMYELGGDR